MTVLDRQAVLDAARRHEDNWEAIAFELDSDPETVQALAANGNGSASAPPPIPAEPKAKPMKTCADPECSTTFVPGTNAQKYCKGQDCKRRRWAREKRAESGNKPRAAKTAPAPSTPATARQDQPPPALADRYLAALLERATADLTPEQARAELERLGGLS